MPRNIYVKDVKKSGDDSISAGRGSGQMGWYTFVASHLDGKKVLDAGAGLGRGSEVLREKAAHVDVQDIDPQLEEKGVLVCDISDFEDNSYDIVTAFDVIEHVELDSIFLSHLCRIAREKVILTTPLWNYRLDFWPYHIREYTFREFHSLVIPFGDCTFYKGSGPGSEIFKVNDLEQAFRIERMINNDITNVPVRLLQKFMPGDKRHAGHQCVFIDVSAEQAKSSAA